MGRSDAQLNVYTAAAAGGRRPSGKWRRIWAGGILAEENRISGKDVCLTLVQPVTEPVEDDVLFARRHQADRAAAHRGAIVNVVLKDEDLKKIIEIKQKRDN